MIRLSDCLNPLTSVFALEIKTYNKVKMSTVKFYWDSTVETRKFGAPISIQINSFFMMVKISIANLESCILLIWLSNSQCKWQMSSIEQKIHIYIYSLAWLNRRLVQVLILTSLPKKHERRLVLTSLLTKVRLKVWIRYCLGPAK